MLLRRTPGALRQIVLVRPEANLDRVAEAATAAGAQVLWRLPLVHGLIVTCPGPATCAALLGIPGVAAVEDDSRTSLPPPLRPLARPVPRGAAAPAARAASSGAAPALAAPPALGAPGAAAASRRALVAWGVARIGAPLAWTRSRGEGVKVAIIDTGVDWTHPALATNVHGGVNILSPGDPPDDDHGHGTHVAGIIAAADGPGVAVGVAPRCSLYAVKAFDATGAAATGDVLLALEWCAAHGMQVVKATCSEAKLLATK